MNFSIWILLFLFFGQRFVAIVCQEEHLEFKPLTENVSFKVLYKLEFFNDRELVSISNIYEQYQDDLEAANIWEVKEINGANSTIKRYIYNGKTRQDFQIEGHQADGPGELYLEENGSSASYEDLTHQFDWFGRGKQIDNKLNKNTSLESILLSGSGELNLDSFLHEHCRNKVKSELHYIRGLSKLFHLIECRRDELLLNLAQSSNSNLTTRGSSKKVYMSSKDLELISADGSKEQVESIGISVSMEDSDNNDAYLPSKSIPLSLSLSYVSKASNARTRIILNIFEFNQIQDLNEHLSESWSSMSVYQLPVASGLDDISSPPPYKPDDAIDDKETTEEFSFKALLTGTEYASSYRDPIELVIALDSASKLFVRELAIRDRSVSLVHSWKMRRSRTVYDGKAALKYHVESESDIEIDKLSQTSIDTREPWTECVTSSLSKDEYRLIIKQSDFFQIENSLFLGMALVRGIPCNVYEKRIWIMPFWIFGYEAQVNPNIREIYLTMYEAVRSSSEDAKKRGNLLRMIITGKAANSSIIASYNLEIFSFHWSANGIQSYHDEKRSLFNIAPECLLSNADLNHLDLEFDFSSNELDGLKALELEQEEALRNRIVTNAIEESLEVPKNQQTSLETTFKWDKSTNRTSIRLQVKLSIYETPKHSFMMNVIGLAEDLGEKTYEDPTKWLIGVNRVSFEECRWLASHTLYSNQLDSIDERKFMYCQGNFHCVLDDQSWSVIGRKSFRVDGILQSRNSSNSGREECTLHSLRRVKFNTSLSSKFKTQGLTLFQWLSTRRPEELAEIPFQLKLNNGQSVQMTTNRVKTSGLIAPSDSSSSLRQIHGLGFVKPEKFASLRVSNLAQCSHLCFLEHECNSYSICHEKAGFECILSRINLTESSKMKELKNAIPGNGLKTISMEILNDEVPIKVNFRRSPLCSLHSKNHLEAFEQRGSEMVVISKPGILLYADSAEDCANLCISRAEVLSNLRRFKKIDESSFDVCSSFEFGLQDHLCKLKPEVNLGDYFASTNDKLVTNESISLKKYKKLFETWRRAFERIQSNVQNLAHFSDVDYYNLNYEKLFIANFGRRLMLINNDNFMTDSNELQRIYTNMNNHECAHLCLLWHKCKSFDIYTSKEAQHKPSSSSCYLNAASYNNMLNSDQKQQPFKAINQNLIENSDEGNWWHYEPSELALFFMGSLNISNTQTGIFIHTNINSDKDDNEPSGTDWSKAVRKNKQGHIGLWFMFSIVFIMMAIVVVYIASKTTKSINQQTTGTWSFDRRQLLR